MPFATHPPRCPVRLANTLRRHLLAVSTAVVVIASARVVASAESQVRFVEPTCRSQPRHVGETAPAAPPARRLRFVLVAPKSDRSSGTRTEEIQLSTMILSSEVPRDRRLEAARPARLAQRGSPMGQVDAPLAEPIPSPGPTTELETVPCFVPQPLSQVTVDIGLPDGGIPVNAAMECAASALLISDARQEVGWAGSEVHWIATGLCHRPLYFEEVNPERYGYTPSYFFQPVISAGRFFLTIPALPYKMVVERPHDCIYTLGHYRPGTDGVPRRWHRLPLHLTAATVEVGVIAGLILLIP